MRCKNLPSLYYKKVLLKTLSMSSIDIKSFLFGLVEIFTLGCTIFKRKDRTGKEKFSLQNKKSSYWKRKLLMGKLKFSKRNKNSHSKRKNLKWKEKSSQCNKNSHNKKNKHKSSGWAKTKTQQSLLGPFIQFLFYKNIHALLLKLFLSV